MARAARGGGWRATAVPPFAAFSAERIRTKRRAQPVPPRGVAGSCSRLCACVDGNGRFRAEPQLYGQFPALPCRDGPRERMLQARGGEPVANFVIGKSQAPVREFAAAELDVVRREIDDQQVAVRAQNARGFNHSRLRILQVMQHLMENREIEALDDCSGWTRQAMNIGEADLAMPRADTLEAVACDRQHLGTDVHVGPLSDLRREKLEHAAGPRARVENRIVRQCGDGFENGGLDILVRRVKGTNALP